MTTQTEQTLLSLLAECRRHLDRALDETVPGTTLDTEISDLFDRIGKQLEAHGSTDPTPRGSFDEAAEHVAFQAWWPTEWPNRGSVPDVVWQGWLGRARLAHAPRDETTSSSGGASDVAWTPELEKARLDLCEYWIGIAGRPELTTYGLHEISGRAAETEQALTILGDIVARTTPRPAPTADERIDLARNAYLAGFMASCEAWNFELPFGPDRRDPRNADPRNDAKWVETRDKALTSLGTDGVDPPLGSVAMAFAALSHHVLSSHVNAYASAKGMTQQEAERYRDLVRRDVGRSLMHYARTTPAAVVDEDALRIEVLDKLIDVAPESFSLDPNLWLREQRESMAADMLERKGVEPFVTTYRNYEGEVAERRIVPVRVHFGSNRWHPEPQWLMSAYDVVGGKWRDFALSDVNHDGRASRLAHDIACIDFERGTEHDQLLLEDVVATAKAMVEKEETEKVGKATAS